MLRSFSSKCVVLFGAGTHHHLLQPTLQSLRCTSAAGLSLMQVRGAKRKFGGIHVDPFNLRRRNHRIEQFKKSQKKPLMSEERLKKKIDLPYNVTSLSMYMWVWSHNVTYCDVCEREVELVGLLLCPHYYWGEVCLDILGTAT